jgi:hypothetical protein
MWAGQFLEVLVYRIVVNIVVAVLLARKFHDEAVAKASLENALEN